MSRLFVQLLSLSKITFLESIRHRALIGLLTVALAFMGFSLVLSALALRDQALRVVTNFGVFSLSFLGVVIAIILGVILVYKEIERKTIYTVLAKPVPRPLFVLGKYLGLAAMLVVTLSLLAGAWFMVVMFRGGEPGIDHIYAVTLIFGEVLLVTSVAVFFSTFASPILSGIFTFGFFLIGRSVPVIEHMLARRTGLFVDVPGLRPMGELLVTGFPDLTVFQASNELLHGIPISTSYVVQALGYSCSYSVVLLSLGVLIFQRRDFI